MREVAKRFGENLARYRAKAGISQETLGVRAGLHRTEISLLERGTRVPRIDTVIKLAGALELTPNDLLADITWNVVTIQAGAFRVSPPSE